MEKQDQVPSDLPAAVGQVNGESDIIAERAGVELRETRRPIPAEPIEPPPDPEQKVEHERREADEEGEEAEDPSAHPEPTG
ncbi:hypothetical protein [Nonomuraea jiangxiensis]|uniref:Uncharacterized protein n=1 Tax=Nonomuraea jiangxiensis TaxID=633440 RepID=A0A1G9IY51_9ACTN|nr:hypothetical protein [Nonomuraea jiangxiensis]SDL29956.1 hypothetical protein SAMN05421869_12483 [Nonomuraea jiangxiensis]